MGLHILAATAAAIAIRSRRYGPEPRRRQNFVAACPRALDMRPAPIEPTWILAGRPQARVATHSTSDDRFATTAVWDCTAGSFRWFFGWDETVVILEGDVHVSSDDGTARVLRAGDVAYFRADSWATWRVDSYVRKVAFVRRPLFAPLAIVFRVEAALRSRIGRCLRR